MKKVQVAILAAAICLAAAGCGNTLQKSANPSASIYHYKEQSITMQAQPKRIVTLSTPLLNMAYAVGGTSLARPTTSSPIPDSASALMASPLITTLVDTCSIIVYFNIATTIFKI